MVSGCTKTDQRLLVKFNVSYDLENVGKLDGILYILELDVDGNRVVKVGLTRRDNICERVCEITTSYFQQYRYFPYVRPKRFRHVVNVYAKEQYILKYFKDKKYKSEKKFSGCEELLDVDVEQVVQVYEQLIEEDYANTKKRGRKRKQVGCAEEAGAGTTGDAGGSVSEVDVQSGGMEPIADEGSTPKKKNWWD